MAIYEWQSEINKVVRIATAQETGEEVERVRKSLGGEITCRQLWESQKDSESVLHEAFTWDDKI